MDEIGNYIYILLIAIAGLSSLLKSKKKQREVVIDDGDDDRSFGDEWKDIFQDNEKNEVPKQIPTIEVKPVAQPVIKQNTKKQSYSSFENIGTDFTTLRAKRTIDIKRSVPFIEIEEDVDESYTFSLESTTDIRNAIIANEVFSRKYF